MNDPIIIIGAGLAGYQLAREFRKVDPTTPLWIITADEGHFYSKPQLSVALTNQKTAHTLITTPAEEIAKQLNLTLFPLTQVTAIHSEQQTIQFNDKTYPYRQLVLALGAAPSRPPLQGDAIQDVLSVNHLDDYAIFREKISDKKHITLLGAGLIGCEFANDLVNTGHTVHVITPAPTPMELLLPLEMGRIFQAALTQKGIHFHTECVASKINHVTSHQYEVTLSDGSQFKTDAVLSATGLKPIITLAKAANLQTNIGIVANRFLETSAPHIYTIGDCAEVEGFILPYITPLLNCARALARTLSGTRTAVSYPAMPVTIKTPACPTVVCPPPKKIAGTWVVDVTEAGARGLFYDEAGTLYGFILMKGRISERMELMKRVPALI